MAMREDIDRLEQRLADSKEANRKLADELREVKEELRHYQMAVSAVRWLWEQAQKQQPFQL